MRIASVVRWDWKEADIASEIVEALADVVGRGALRPQAFNIDTGGDEYCLVFVDGAQTENDAAEAYAAFFDEDQEGWDFGTSG